jgi:hypothetical protein
MAWASQQPTWAIGFADEVWWSRFALPHLHAWQSKQYPVRLQQQSWQKDDPDPKALACYGVLWQKGTAADPIRQDMSLRFVSGRPVSDITTQFLAWCCARLEKQSKTAWLLIWDNASWHNSKCDLTSALSSMDRLSVNDRPDSLWVKTAKWSIGQISCLVQSS